MDYAPRYTEDEKPYELDEEFVTQVRTLPRHLLVEVLRLLHDNADYLVGPQDKYIEIGGVVELESPYFFKIGYVFYYSDTPVLVSFEEISQDEYLDLILEDSYLINLD